MEMAHPKAKEAPHKQAQAAQAAKMPQGHASASLHLSLSMSLSLGEDKPEHAAKAHELQAKHPQHAKEQAKHASAPAHAGGAAAKHPAGHAPAGHAPVQAAHGKADAGHKKSAMAPAAHAHVPSMLAVGLAGAEVRMLQLLLIKHGLDVGPVDGVFGPLTQHAVLQFQIKVGVEVDGVVGPNTWGHLRDHSGAHQAEKAAGQPHLPAHVKEQQHKAPAGHQGAPKGHAAAAGKSHAANKTTANAHAHHPGAAKPAHHGGPAPVKHAPAAGHKAAKGGARSTKDLGKDAKLRQEILQIAGSQIGTKEKGNNGGGAEKYQKAFGRGHEPWCADFVSWVMSKSGKPTNSPYCPTFIQKLKKQGQWKGHKNPQPGDIVFFDWDHNGTADHVGIVKHVNADGSITTIEGNTGNPKGGGEGVFQKQRYQMQIIGFANP